MNRSVLGDVAVQVIFYPKVPEKEHTHLVLRLERPSQPRWVSQVDGIQIYTDVTDITCIGGAVVGKTADLHSSLLVRS